MKHNAYYEGLGELEVRTLSEKAFKGYSSCDSLNVFYDKDTELFDIVYCDQTKSGLTREQAEKELEFWADEADEED